MRVFVTGATGFLGTDLTKRLLVEGHSVHVLVRSREKAITLAALGAELVVGTITDRKTLYDALKGVDVIYHLAGKLFEPCVPTAEYYHIHLEGTQILLDCCKESHELKRFIFTSTTGVLGPSGDTPLDESAPAAPTNAYEDSKWKAEQQVQQAIQFGFPATIIRPGFVYGPGDLHLVSFFRMIQRGFFRPIGTNPVWLHPIYIEDMTRAFLCCMEHPLAVGECFHISGERPVTISELASSIAKALEKPVPKGNIPLPLARLAASVGDLLPVNIKKLAPLTYSRLDFLTHSRIYNVSKAYRLLGFTASINLADGIAQTIAWYKQHGYL